MAVPLTGAGPERFERVKHAWRAWLGARLGDITMSGAGDKALLDQALSTISGRLVDEDPAAPVRR
ncbi:hypothetical protein QLQ12_28285 [Actinoplanes sp. NEAU-A12]|uniref:Uncharacterized protein n=1 Tax=Actinoplanes sandaracinus TaxID=3045177 RepID=A0ABT6WS26_9ACTN|nr:hypothetical protein [Actinoplanes sandaracinus]MDI6102525.1 hypothetical protein [Actinoplanes sandaracinus]